MGDLNILNILDEIFSSSSSSEEDYEDFNNLNINRRDNDRRIPRIRDYMESVVMRYNDEEFRQNFRLKRNTYEYILCLIRPDLEGQWMNGFGRLTISPEKQLLIALWILGTPDSYRSVTTKFNVGQTTAWRAVFRVVKALCKFRNYFIQWPSLNQAQESSNRIAALYGFPGVIGAVDGTHISIAAPKNDPQSYVNRKGFHSVQLQVICNDKLEFMHTFVGLPGCVHDMRVLKYSGVQERCNEQFFPNDTHLLGDSAYTLQKHVMVPYKDNGHLTEQEILFNTTLSRSRMMVERSIGLLKGRWRYFLDKLPMRRTDIIPHYVLAACILHNVCLKRNDNFEYPVIIPNNLDDNVEPQNVSNYLKEEGARKRENIKRLIAGN